MRGGGLAAVWALVIVPGAVAGGAVVDMPLPGASAPQHLGVAVLSNGDVAIAWIETVDGSFHLAVARPGPTWTWVEAREWPKESTRADFPVVGSTRSGLVAVWQRSGGGTQDLDIWYAVRPVAGGPWTDPLNLHPRPGRQTLPRLSCDSEACYAVWQEESAPNAGDWSIVGERIVPTDATKVRLSDNPPGSKADFPDVVALGQGRVLVAWDDQRNASAHEIRFASWPASDGTDPSVPLETGRAGIRTNPSLARLHDGTVLAGWVDSINATQRTLRYATSRDGSRWDAPTELPGPVETSAPNHPSAVDWPGRAHGILWEDARDGLPRLAFTDTASHGTWMLPRSATSVRQSDGHAFTAGGHDYVLFLERSGASTTVRLYGFDGAPALATFVQGATTNARAAGPLAVGVLVVLAAVALRRR